MSSIKSLSAMAGMVTFAFTAVALPDTAHAQERPWWEKSNCHGMEGVSWIECQKAISQNKRDREAGRPPSNQAWWDKSKCLGLEGTSWSNCQRARSEAKRNPGVQADPWMTNQCIGLEGLAFVECHEARKRVERQDR